ncbi:MAG: 3-oxoacyl-[acyl-carrier-protein] synthase III C-terminal domain-containing protein [Alphaproteobacteria bacterium]
MAHRPRLTALATAVPAYRLAQAEVLARAERLFDRGTSEIGRMLAVYGNSGIEQRYSCMPLEWYEAPHGWADKNRHFLRHAVDLLERAATDCLNEAGLNADDIDGIVAVSTTGIATPSLDALLMDRMPFRRDCWRLPVFGLGCAGGVLGLARAAALAKAEPGQKILYLVVELCALTFRRDDQSKSNIIASALFGDGAAAAIVTCNGRDGESDAEMGPEITAWGEHCWPNSLGVMGWRVEDDGLGVVFSRDIPRLVRTELRLAAENFLVRHGMRLTDLSGFICHPGGAKVIDALEDAFGLAPGAMTEARAVLRQYGNMSAVTVMFVMKRVLERRARGRHLMSALGPGFTAAFLTLDLP